MSFGTGPLVPHHSRDGKEERTTADRTNRRPKELRVQPFHAIPVCVSVQILQVAFAPERLQLRSIRALLGHQQVQSGRLQKPVEQIWTGENAQHFERLHFNEGSETFGRILDDDLEDLTDELIDWVHEN